MNETPPTFAIGRFPAELEQECSRSDSRPFDFAQGRLPAVPPRSAKRFHPSSV